MKQSIFIATFSVALLLLPSVSFAQKRGWKLARCGSESVLMLASDSSLWAAGSTNAGQLGLGLKGKDYKISKLYPVGKDKDWIDVDMSDRHSLGVKNDGSLWGWGSNYAGQIGQSPSFSDFVIPIQINRFKPKGDVKMKSVYAAHFGPFSLGVDRHGGLHNWGMNSNGEMGSGDTQMNEVPKRIDAGNVRMVSAGEMHTVCVTETGKLVMWGGNEHKQLAPVSLEPMVVTPREYDSPQVWMYAKAIASHTFGIREDGTLWFWGESGPATNGLEEGSDITTPTKIELPGKVLMLDGSRYFTIAIVEEGSTHALYAWGMNDKGQLAQPAGENHDKPVKIVLPDGVNPVDISCGDRFAVLLSADGRCFSWGSNNFGQLAQDKDPMTTAFSAELKEIELPAAVGVNSVARADQQVYYANGIVHLPENTEEHRSVSLYTMAGDLVFECRTTENTLTLPVSLPAAPYVMIVKNRFEVNSYPILINK